MNDKDKTGARAWSQWFEIPVIDFDRAKTFYETIFALKLEVVDFGGFKMGIFPHTGIGVAICLGEGYKPSADGTVVYMDANPDLTEVQNRIEAAGGKIIMAKKQISPEYGFMALFLDSEGNRLGLHSKE
jgi:predicted enzyme related to lactoylglutathione lyase